MATPRIYREATATSLASYSPALQPGPLPPQPLAGSTTDAWAGQSHRRLSMPSIGSMPGDVFKTLSPVQATGLFAAGLVTALGLRWFGRGLAQQGLQKSLRAPKQADMSLSALRTAAQGANQANHHVERQTAIYFQRGLEGVVMMALKYPELQNRLKAYLGAGILGYAAGSFAQGTQEVWIRREETQIRADLVNTLQDTFRASLQKKIAYDASLRQYGKQALLQTFKRHRLPHAEALLEPNLEPSVARPLLVSHSAANERWRYPFEPVHFTTPVNTPFAAFSGDFSGRSEDSFNPIAATASEEASLKQRNHMKTLVYGTGVATGLLLQGFQQLLSQHASAKTIEKTLKHGQNAVKHTLLEITNAMDREAMFLMGSNKVLLSVLGLTAAARVGKLLLDGYREIEVTRQHADTERRYQRYNWLGLDPNFHAIAEREGLQAQLNRFSQALERYPHLTQNRPFLQDSALGILNNIGRESAPRYFPMTPAVNLVAARS